MEEETFDAWSGWADDNDVLEKKDDEETENFVKRFGLIPKFACAYEVLYNNETSCLECSCGFWNRIHLPCRHLAAVICNYYGLSELYLTGFPMTSIGVCWINDCYYHQMNSNMNNKHLNVAIQNLIQQDSGGLYCPPNLKDEENYSPDSNILKLFNSPTTARVLNYTENKILQQVVGTDNDVHDDTFPVGYSQVA